MMYQYEPVGVCSMRMNIEVEGEIIKKVQIIGGCDVNTKGVSVIGEGKNINEAIKRLKGIDCRGRGTSCPDQLAIALEQIKNQM